MIKPERNSSELLEKLFTDDEHIELSVMDEDKLQLSNFNSYQCIYLLNLNELSNGLSNALIDFTNNGGSICIFPGNNVNIESYNYLFSRLETSQLSTKDTTTLKMDALNYQHELFSEVFLREDEDIELPYIKESYRFQRYSSSRETNVITSNNGSAAFTETPFGYGKIYKFSFPLDSENK